MNSLCVFIYCYKFDLYACMLNDLEKNEKGNWQIHNVCGHERPLGLCEFN